MPFVHHEEDMPEKFGDLLRRIREDSKVSMGALARHLNVSVVYVSDVERNSRAPLTLPRILAASALMQKDPRPLLDAALNHKGAAELPLSISQEHRDVGAALMRGWQDYGPEE